jgi:hypothetical protein
MMSRHLSPGEWGTFFDAFSRRFRGRCMSLQIAEAAGAAAHMLADRLPLLGVALRPTRGLAESIQLVLGYSPVQNVVHVVRQPARVRVAQVSDGEDEQIVIESAAGETVTLDFGSATNCAASSDSSGHTGELDESRPGSPLATRSARHSMAATTG